MPEREYWFACGCGTGCEQRSESLGEHYGRLSKDTIWVHDECLEKAAPDGYEKLRPFKGGHILQEVDF